MYQITTTLGIRYNNNMELPSTEGPSNWDEARGNIPEGIYTMNEYDEEDLEDGKPFAENQPNNTTDNNTPSPQMRDLSYIQNTEKRFDKGYDSDGEDEPDRKSVV